MGIGASAGGLESLELLFGAIPPDTGMAFIVVQHLSPDFRSLMDELIARHSEMPVVIATDGMPVLANRIHLMPPRKEMIIRDRHLVLTDKEPHVFTLPIDQFFRSLAQDVGEQSVAIVLSGSGSDGSRGIVDVARVGGLVLAESPTSAKFDGMPLSAGATGVVAQVHPPRELARALCGLPPLEEAAPPVKLDDDPALDAVLRQLRDHFGIDFSLYKTTTVGRRIQRRVDLLRFSSLREYVEQLGRDPAELNLLYQDLLIGVTQFFRDPEAYAVIETQVIPQLLDSVPPGDELRVWTAGCATGEEAYSLAMLLWEAFARRQRPVRLKILATDVHQVSLETASAGVYGEDQLQFVSPERMQRFFARRASGYQVSQDLRQLIVFARHNVTKDAPFTKMHLISCRNMLIYLQPQAQRTVLSLFHFGLAARGVLFMGASETPGSLSDEFTAIDDHWKIFRKKRDVQLLSQVRLPLERAANRRVPRPLDLPRTSGPDPMVLATYDQLLDRFMPPGFLLDEQRNLIDSFAGAERLLTMRRRRPSSNLLDMLDDELRAVVAGAVQRALADNAAVAYAGVRVPTTDGQELRCTVSAEPMVHPRTNARHIVVTFTDQHAEARVGPVASAPPSPAMVTLDEAARERMTTLESELAYTRETLQATIEELETSNEEMQATNEELVASNEELQSTNEELHSVNEELYTVNAEYQHKIVELRELNADMAHLLEGTDVGTVFLDEELRIRRFTARIASVFRFKAHDIGRQITDFSHNILRPTLTDEVEQVQRTGDTIEDEVRDRAGTPWFLRILPYRAGSGAPGEPPQIQGVVLTLTDMTALAKARGRLAQLSAIVESSDDAIVGKALDGTITAWNRGAQALYGYTAEEAVGRNASILMQPGEEHELASFVERIRRGEKVEHVRSLRMRKDGAPIEVAMTISPILDADGALVGLSAIGRDISPLLRAQRELEQNALHREQFIAMLSHELRNPLAAVLNATSMLREADAGVRERRQAVPADEAGLRERCQAVISRQAHHMGRLLDDLLDVSRITRGKFELRTGEIDLRAAIEAAVEATAPLYQERGVRLESELPTAAMWTHGDSSRLTQVVGNLLSNAANYSPRSSSVRLVVAVAHGCAVIRVVDQGVGIELELQDKIFDLFVQSEQRLDRSRGGLGVGLSLARNIVELHGGAIAVHSDGPGHGSEFVVTLPLTGRAVAAAPQVAATEGSASTARRRIVLVDDQEDAREMLRMLLESRDHEVFDAGDGPTALELIERERPDIAFIDIGLPEMNGYEVAEQIRARPELAAIRLVALTGYGAPSDVQAARDAGFDEHVIKPAALSRIEQILEAM